MSFVRAVLCSRVPRVTTGHMYKNNMCVCVWAYAYRLHRFRTDKRTGDGEQIAAILLWFYINYEKCTEKTNRIFDGRPTLRTTMFFSFLCPRPSLTTDYIQFLLLNKCPVIRPIRYRRTRAHSYDRQSRLKYRRPKTSFMKRRSDMNCRPENPFDRLHSDVRVCSVTTNVVVHGRFPCRPERKVRKVICKNISLIHTAKTHFAEKTEKTFIFERLLGQSLELALRLMYDVLPVCGQCFFSPISITKNYISFRL